MCLYKRIIYYITTNIKELFEPLPPFSQVTLFIEYANVVVNKDQT